MDISPEDQLATTLARLLAEADPVPPAVVAAAKAAFIWGTVDAELAELLADSADLVPAGVRTTETARHLTFATDQLELELVISGAPGRLRLDGQLVPPGVARVELRCGQEFDAAVDADHLGRFSFDLADTRRLQLLVATPDGRRIATPWLPV